MPAASYRCHRARGMVEEHGGTITAGQSQGETTIELVLPVRGSD